MSERIVGSIQKVGFLFFFCWFVLVYFHNWNIRVFVAGTCLCKEYYMYPDDHTLSLHGVCDVLEHIKWSDGKLIPWCAQYMYPTQKINTNSYTTGDTCLLCWYVVFIIRRLLMFITYLIYRWYYHVVVRQNYNAFFLTYGLTLTTGRTLFTML